MTRRELQKLWDKVRVTQKKAPSDYTRGYLDALQYVLDWMEEDEES